MQQSLNPRFEFAPAMVLTGVRRDHRTADASRTIAAQWQEFRSMGLRQTRAPRAFGVYLRSQTDTFEYMTALDRQDVENMLPSLASIHIPPQRYAVFVHKGPVAGLGEARRRMLEEWLPSSEYEKAATPAFELYDHRFDPETADGEVEIWLPVEEKAA